MEDPETDPGHSQQRPSSDKATIFIAIATLLIASIEVWQLCEFRRSVRSAEKSTLSASEATQQALDLFQAALMKPPRVVAVYFNNADISFDAQGRCKLRKVRQSNKRLEVELANEGSMAISAGLMISGVYVGRQIGCLQPPPQILQPGAVGSFLIDLSRCKVDISGDVNIRIMPQMKGQDV